MSNGAPWTPADVGAAGLRPGFYMNFLKGATDVVRPGARGVVGIMSEADWGDPNVVQTFDTLEAAAEALVARESATHRLYRLTQFAFAASAQQVKAVRVLNTSNAAKSTLNLQDGSATPVIRVDAKYVGTYGDNISVEVTDDPVDNTKTRVRVYVESELVHEVTSTVNSGAAEFIDDVVALLVGESSTWIDVTKLANGDNSLADVAAAANLAGGANGDAITVTEFNAALNLFSADRVHLLSTDSVVAGVQSAVAAWVDDRREEGYRAMAVLGSDTGDSATTIVTDAQAFNDHGVVYVAGGFVAPDLSGVTKTYNGAMAASAVAGMIAGVPLGSSVTYGVLPYATGAETFFSNTQVRSMLTAGAVPLTPTPTGSPGVRIERGITTLITPGADDISDFKSIRTVRIMDGIADGLGIAAATFIGRQLNDDNGRSAILDAVKDFLRGQAEARTIETDFEVGLDDSQDNSGDELFLNITVRPIGAVEYIFSTIRIL